MRKNIIKIFLFVLALLVVFVFLRKQTENFFLKTTQPLANIFSGLFAKLDICYSENNDILVKKLIEKEKQIIVLEEILKKQGLMSKAKENGFAGAFLGDVVLKNKAKDFIIIANNKESPLQKGQVVLADNFALLGNVEDVLPNFVRVKLITAKDNIFDVVIGSDSLALGRGQGGGELLGDLLKKEDAITQGVVVKTKASSGKFPKDIIVGEIVDIEEKPAESYNQAKIAPYFLFSSLEQVYVLTNFIPLEQEAK